MLPSSRLAPAVLLVALMSCGVVPPAAAAHIPMGQRNAGPLPDIAVVSELPDRVSSSDDGAWNSIYIDNRQYEGYDEDGLVVVLTANIQVFKIQDAWPEYDWYLVSLHTQTEVTPGSYQQNFPAVPFTSGSVGWYFQDSQTRIDAGVYGDGPLALEDYGPLSSPAGVTDSFTIGGGLSLTPSGPGGSIDGRFTRAITHPSVAISDTSSMVSKYGSWSEDFFCPHGSYEWWPVVDWPSDESQHSHRMDYAVIVKVVGGQPDKGVHVSVNVHAFAYRDDMTNYLVYIDGTRWPQDLGEDGIEVSVYRNNPPEVTAFYPNYTPVPAQAGQRLDFSVSWSDPDGTPDSVTWYLDDVEQGSGESWAWNIPSGAGGPTGTTHVIKAVIADEHDTTTQLWDVHVAAEDAPLVANFSASPTVGLAPLQVAFTDLSTNDPISWAWGFGDGGTSLQQHVSHTYTSAGTYTVSLTATNAAGSDTETKAQYIVVSFPDVAVEPEEHWALAEILACVDAGIVQGYPGGGYRPAEAVTRGQMAVYIARALAGGEDAVPEPSVVEPTFSDVDSAHWAYRYVEHCADRDIVQGYPDGGYHPDEAVNRGQMAVYTARADVAPPGDASVPDDTDGASFDDVTEAGAWAWCFKHVEYCAGAGLVQGYADNTYRPAVIVTRDQMAVYIARMLDLPL
jgi:PKD repeat protein